jgi:hypothetical protein
MAERREAETEANIEKNMTPYQRAEREKDEEWIRKNNPDS